MEALEAQIQVRRAVMDRGEEELTLFYEVMVNGIFMTASHSACPGVAGWCHHAQDTVL